MIKLKNRMAGEIDTTRQIIERARTLFDVAGVSQASDGRKLVILGLRSTPERDLDYFGVEQGVFHMYGYRKHVKPRIESLLGFIRRLGFSAQTVGKYGYPLEGEINLKEEAIRSGLGRRGKNTVVLHPEYGPWLRFAAIRTEAPLELDGNSALLEEENPVCRECSICVDVCPVKALKPYHMPDISICLSNITRRDEKGRSILCDLCLQLCPAGKDGFTEWHKG